MDTANPNPVVSLPSDTTNPIMPESAITDDLEIVDQIMVNGSGSESVLWQEEENETMDYNEDSLSSDEDLPDNQYSSDDQDELEAMLDENLPDDFKRTPVPDPKRLRLARKRKMDQRVNHTNSVSLENGTEEIEDDDYNEKEITVLEKIGLNNFDMMPGGWIEVRHSSGMPLYLHRKTRVCTLAKPYFLGPGSVRRHSIPLDGIPCLAYKRALERRAEEKNRTTQQRTANEEMIPDSTPNSNSAQVSNSVSNNEALLNGSHNKEAFKNLLPCAKVETASENNSMYSIDADELRQYCEGIFKFKRVKCKRFKTWSARRRHTKEQKRLHLQRPTLPEGVKLITFPVQNAGGEADNGKSNKEYIMNPQGKSSVCILHEYVQHALRKQPSYNFRELENAATPYAATVVINGMQYGSGYGSSKKTAKAEAAKSTLEILIPQMKEQLDESKTNSNPDFDISSFFKQVELTDARITKMCSSFSEPSPYTLLLTCLQRNFGQGGSNNIQFEMIATGNQTNKFKMTTGTYEVEVTASNKREGKQLASQALLAKIHPHIHNFGSFLKLYGNGSIKSVKEKKQEEQKITVLQSKASANCPNYAILNKLREEMKKMMGTPESTSSAANSTVSASQRDSWQPMNVATSSVASGIPNCDITSTSNDIITHNGK